MVHGGDNDVMTTTTVADTKQRSQEETVEKAKTLGAGACKNTGSKKQKPPRCTSSRLRVDMDTIVIKKERK